MRRYGCPRGRVLVADRGFDGRHVQEGDVIPPIRRGGGLADARRAARAELVAAARLEGVGQRWKSETVISVIKRRLGDVIRARRRRLQPREPALKALIYHLHR
ncbi:MAG: hypothetical protein NZ765_12455 [Anaerolineae bacterium]|nr:hypothetical protein [Anaerolineae bacterium]MDW8071836.1 hypothetical protein [Anaerolineae bacterium]